MRVLVKRQNVSDKEVARAISGYILGEGIQHDVIERLQKAEINHKPEPIPEKYVRGIDARMHRTFDSLMETLVENIDRWIDYQSSSGMKKSVLKKADDTPPVLSQKQIDELKMLIEQHFRVSIGLGYIVPDTVAKQWQKAGIKPPTDDLEKWIKAAYVAGRLANVLKNSSTYEEMTRKAVKLAFSRIDELVIQMAKNNAAKYVVGYALRLSSLAENVMLNHNKKLMGNVIQQYFTGDLRHTKYNGAGLKPNEIASLETDKEVNGWKELATELKNRFKNVDAGRDWDRIAQTEIRYSTNMGRLVNIQVEGGGDPDEIEVYYHVQPQACRYCKQLFLEPDATPKIFKLSHILKNVAETGGLNFGLKASMIGEQDGWVANATCHPNGHCYPVRRIPGYRLIPVGDIRKE